MIRRSENLELALQRFLPEGSVDKVCEMLRRYPHHLQITGPRTTKLGDFTPGIKGRQHHLSVNGNLNRYAFLITLMHELAHLITYLEYKDAVRPHGEEWKNNFKKTLSPFLTEPIFPPEISAAVKEYLLNPKAATCSDIQLSKVLAQHDRTRHPNIKLLDDIPANARFVYGRERQEFIKGKKIRTRYSCVAVTTRQEYLFNPLTKIWYVEQ